MRTPEDDHKCPTCGGCRWELSVAGRSIGVPIKLLKCVNEECNYSLLILPSTFWQTEEI